MADEGVQKRMCVSCHRLLPDDANVCPSCGHDYRRVMMGRAWEEENTPLPPIGGALIALSGYTQIISGLLWIFSDTSDFLSDIAESRRLLVAMATTAIIVGLFAGLVSIYTMTRRRLVLSLVAGVASLGMGTLIVTYALSYYIAPTLALVGVLLIAMARDEFID